MDAVVGERYETEHVFVLIDVEGAELSVLHGATRLLSRTAKPVWMVEVATGEHVPGGRNPTRHATFELFQRHGYRAWELARGEIKPVGLCAGDDQPGAQSHNFVFADQHSIGPRT